MTTAYIPTTGIAAMAPVVSCKDTFSKPSCVTQPGWIESVPCLKLRELARWAWSKDILRLDIEIQGQKTLETQGKKHPDPVKSPNLHGDLQIQPEMSKKLFFAFCRLIIGRWSSGVSSNFLSMFCLKVS